MRLFEKIRKRAPELDLLTVAGSLGYFWFSYFCLRLAIRYTTVNDSTILPSGLAWIGPENSIFVWGILWGLASIGGMVGAVLLLFRHYKPFFASSFALIGLHVVWAVVYLGGWLFGDDRVGWLNSGTYFAPIGLLVAFIGGAIRASAVENAKQIEKDRN